MQPAYIRQKHKNGCTLVSWFLDGTQCHLDPAINDASIEPNLIGIPNPSAEVQVFSHFLTEQRRFYCICGVKFYQRQTHASY